MRVPTTYTDALQQQAEIADQIAAAKTRFDRGLELMQQGIDQLSSLSADNSAGGFKNTIQFVSQQALANANDEQWQTLKDQQNKIVADFAADLSSMTAKINAAKSA
jgi:hypothetical protein